MNPPSGPQDHKLRVFSRDSNPAVVAALREAFLEWVHRRFDGTVQVFSLLTHDLYFKAVKPADLSTCCRLH